MECPNKKVSMIRKHHILTTAQWGRAIEHWLSQYTRKTVKVKQPAFSSSLIQLSQAGPLYKLRGDMLEF